MQRLEKFIRQSVPSRRNLCLHREWNPEIRRLTNRRAKEFARGDTNNAVNGRTDRNCFSEGEWFVCESLGPPRVAGDRDGMATRYLVVRVGEQTALLRHQPQYWEIAPRNQPNLHFLQFLPSGNTAMHGQGEALNRRDV